MFACSFIYLLFYLFMIKYYAIKILLLIIFYISPRLLAASQHQKLHHSDRKWHQKIVHRIFYPLWKNAGMKFQKNDQHFMQFVKLYVAL